jgi:hypothetical protein
MNQTRAKAEENQAVAGLGLARRPGHAEPSNQTRPWVPSYSRGSARVRFLFSAPIFGVGAQVGGRLELLLLVIHVTCHVCQ